MIIGTNIFIYYDAFEQSLARVNLAAACSAPGGFVLSNDMLADEALRYWKRRTAPPSK